ncbi:hypothetical protein HWV62_4860 [Athelia sp. TMB]|nr:hypothetical protein HWV62_4860 [Athelia sp. TMB]
MDRLDAEFFDVAACSEWIAVYYNDGLIGCPEEKLEIITASRIEGRAAVKQLAIYGHPQAGAPEMDIVSTERPKTMRMVFYPVAGGQPEEVVLRLQGVICRAALPPKRMTYRSATTSARYLQQSFTLTGFNNPSFNMAVEGAYSIAESLGRHADNMAPWYPGRFEECVAVEVCNRLFTRQNNDNPLAAVDIESSIDPHGSLLTLAGGEYVHTEENTVRYFKYLKSPTGVVSYVNAQAASFKAGDIVEAQLSVIALPSRDGRQTMKLILRAMTLLDDAFSKAARIAFLKTPVRQEARGAMVPPKGKPRRQVGYDEDTVDEMSKRVKGMQMDSDGPAV